MHFKITTLVRRRALETLHQISLYDNSTIISSILRDYKKAKLRLFCKVISGLHYFLILKLLFHWVSGGLTRGSAGCR